MNKDECYTGVLSLAVKPHLYKLQTARVLDELERTLFVMCSSVYEPHSGSLVDGFIFVHWMTV